MDLGWSGSLTALAFVRLRTISTPRRPIVFQAAQPSRTPTTSLGQATTVYLGSGCRQLQFVVGKFVVGVVAVDRKTNELIFEAPNAAISWLGLASSAAQGCGAAGLWGCGAAGRAAALCALWAAMH